MATVALESPAPSLPFEIWAQILEFYEQSNDTDGLKYIWVNCRQVSSQFRAVVDEMFINKHLPTTWFELHQGRISKKLALNQDPVEDEVNNELGARFLPSSVPFLERIGVEYHFSRMSDDRRLAIFRATSSDQRLIRPRLADLVNQTRPSRLNNSRHLVYVGKEVNDIFIPLRWITADKPEFAVDWEELYSVFFAEEKLYSTLATRNIEGTGDFDENRRIARRIRLQRHCRAFNNKLFNLNDPSFVEHEEVTMKILDDARYDASFEYIFPVTFP